MQLSNQRDLPFNFRCGGMGGSERFPLFLPVVGYQRPPGSEKASPYKYIHVFQN